MFQSLLSWISDSNNEQLQEPLEEEMFQSLLSWISDSNHINIRGNARPNCFNPCYRGLVIRTFSFFLRSKFSFGFNPCYRGLVIRTIRSFPIQKTPSCFNPCYRGLVIRTYLQIMKYCQVRVSILVIVD